jgi:hypothetical protein
VRIPVVRRRLEDRIRELCAQAIAANNRDLEAVIEDLKSALHQRAERLRQAEVLNLAKGSNNGGSPPERRHHLP